MPVLMRPWGHKHYVVHAQGTGVPVLMMNSLGTDLRMWQGVAARLPGMTTAGMDKRGHGLSATPAEGWTLAGLAADAVAVMDHLGFGQAVLAGCSVGGIIAQQMAVDNPDRVAGLILSNTAARVGTAETWAARIDAIRAGGMAAIADGVMARWFAPGFLAQPEALPWRTLFLRCDPEGYIGVCRVLAEADLTEAIGRIACPVLMLGGSADQATPPDLVRATAARIPGARVEVLPGSGHIPAIDAPDRVAGLIRDFVGGLA